MQRLGHSIRWIGPIGLMKLKNLIVIFIVCFCTGIHSTMAQQRDYRKDSLQFKIYTRLYVNKTLELDSLVVKKIFCDFCSAEQRKALEEEAYRRSLMESRSWKYKKTGEHRLALYIRLSKLDFKALNNKDE